MVKPITWYCISLILIFVVAGCGATVSTGQPKQEEHLPSPRTISPTVKLTSTPLPSITIKPVQLETLEPENAKETIMTLLQETGDCASPCFWGIVPERTTVGEARNIFNHLGLQMASTGFEGKNYSAVNFDLENGLSIEVILTTENEYVENTQIKINTEIQEDGIARKWLAYSPEALIKRNGPPSRVEFIADWGPGPFFAMQMYFQTVDLIVQYFGNNIIPRQKGSSLVCPLTAQFEGVWIWMGKNPRYPPADGIPLDKATSLTVNEFEKLMTGNPKDACFVLNGDVFP